MVNVNSSKCGQCMKLIRLLVLEGLKRNMRIYAKHVRTNLNGKADALSRLDLGRFRRLGGSSMNDSPTPVPVELWPMEKIWFN